MSESIIKLLHSVIDEGNETVNNLPETIKYQESIYPENYDEDVTNRLYFDDNLNVMKSLMNAEGIK